MTSPERSAEHKPEWLDDVPTGWCACGNPWPCPHRLTQPERSAVDDLERRLAEADYIGEARAVAADAIARLSALEAVAEAARLVAHGPGAFDMRPLEAALAALDQREGEGPSPVLTEATQAGLGPSTTYCTECGRSVPLDQREGTE